MAGFSALLLVTSPSNTDPSLAAAEELLDGWQYRWGDSPRNESNQFTWLSEPWQDTAWKNSDLPNKDVERGVPTKAWYRVRLPDGPISNGLFVRDLHQVFEVYQNQRLIYQAGDLTDGDDIDYLGYNWHLFSLLPSEGTQILSFRVQSDVHGIGFRREAPKLVDASSFLRWRAVSEMDSIVLGVVLLVMSICAFTLFTNNRDDKIFLAYGILTLGLGTWFFVTNMTLTLITGANQILFILNKLSIHFCAIGLCFFVQEVVEPEYKRYAKALWVANLFCLVVGFLTHMTPGFVWTDIGVWFRPFLLITAVLIFILGLLNQRSGTQESRQFLFSFVTLLIALSLELVHFVTVEGRYFVLFMPWGIFAMVLFQGRILFGRYQKVHEDLQVYSKALEQRGEELEFSNQKLLEMDAVKNEFLANTSHEIRTPLHGMIGLAEGLMSEPQREVQTNLSLIINSGQRLSRLIDDILDFSKIEHDDLTLNRKAVSIAPLVDAVFKVTRPLTQGRSIEFELSVPDDCPQVNADENRLHQILLNLVGNAIKFTDKGQIEVSVLSGAEEVTIQVIDTGIGMNVESLRTIFEPYRQVDSHQRSYDGIGLGLSIVKRLVELHDGQVRAESTLGEGTCISFTLPTLRSELVDQDKELLDVQDLHVPSPEQDTQEYETRSSAEGSAPQGSAKGRILVVDDDAVNLQIVTNHLAQSNYRFSTAVNGLDALENIEDDGPFDLVLLDIMMPQMNGFQVCEQLRKQYSALDLPIIFLTAKNQPEDIAEGIQLGGNDYLPKPFQKIELLARVDTQLKLKRAYGHLRENIQLRQEVRAREDEARALVHKQERLTRLLDFMDDAICSVAADGKILFMNAPALSLFKTNLENVQGSDLTSILPGFDFERVREQAEDWPLDGEGSTRLVRDLDHEASVSGDRVKTLFDILFWESASESGTIFIFGSDAKALQSKTASASDASSSRRLRYLELSAETLLEQGEENVAVSASSLVKTSEAIRSDLVRLLCDAIEYWEETAQTTKVDLAEKSELWTVNFEKRGVFRARTMERHQRIETLPKSPRWQAILGTANFVLEACPTDGNRGAGLRENLEQLKLSLGWQVS